MSAFIQVGRGLSGAASTPAGQRNKHTEREPSERSCVAHDRAATTAILLILIGRPAVRVVSVIVGIVPIGTTRIITRTGPTAVVPAVACVIVLDRLAFEAVPIETCIALAVVGTI